MMTTLDAMKADLRKVQATIRKAASVNHDAVTAKLATYAADLKQAFSLENDDIVAGFWPIKSELDPRPLMTAMTALGLKSSLPATPKPGEPLIFHAWSDDDPVIEGLYGTSEPEASAPVVIPKLVFVPMLAFDADGYRLGYGGGFYDRTLAKLRGEGHVVHCIGIAYDIQLVDEVPIGEYDAKLDGVLTETGLLLPMIEEA